MAAAADSVGGLPSAAILWLRMGPRISSCFTSSVAPTKVWLTGTVSAYAPPPADCAVLAAALLPPPLLLLLLLLLLLVDV